MKPTRGWPLIVRLATDDDREAVMAFATNTWNDWDYVPRAWPRWLEARDGVMLVGVVGGNGGRDADGKSLPPGTVIAVVRVAMPAKGEAWLEAIRVDPRVRGMDVATDLQVAELQWAAANGANVVRYATSAANEGSHRLGARGGLEHIVSFLGVSWGPEDEGQSGFEPETQQASQRQRRAVLKRLAAEGAVPGEDMTDRMWRGVSSDVSFSAGDMLYEPRPWALEELTRAEVQRPRLTRRGAPRQRRLRQGRGDPRGGRASSRGRDAAPRSRHRHPADRLQPRRAGAPCRQWSRSALQVRRTERD